MSDERNPRKKAGNNNIGRRASSKYSKTPRTPKIETTDIIIKASVIMNLCKTERRANIMRAVT